jgi:hypothetical protein
MAATPTTRIEIDSDLLDRLRKRRPGHGDRELLESEVRRADAARDARDIDHP